ncbi:septation protein SpoVG [candidate division KSB1 bacterium]|nr:MAG: septation protein SpoVG [candidate division KSB1 bacterium]
MQITNVEINLRNEKKLKGFANIELDGLFVVRGLKIIRGTKGYFIAMPSKPKYDGSFVDIAHPIKREFRTVIENTVLAKYWDEVKRTGVCEQTCNSEYGF